MQIARLVPAFLGALVLLLGVGHAQTAISSSPIPFAGALNWIGSVDAVLDEQRGVAVVVHWTSGGQRETWEWDGLTWDLRDVRPTTLDRGIAHDPLRGRTVLLCADGATHEWDGQTWSQTVATGAGPVLSGAGMAFDGQHIVVFGGRGTYDQVPNELTGVYDGTAWTVVTPTTTPPWRENVQLCYDPARGVVVMMGDHAPAVYEWDGADWSVAGPPPWTGTSRYHFSLAFDAGRGRVWFAGGSSVVTLPTGTIIALPVLDTFEWDGTSWTSTAPLATGAGFAADLTTPTGRAAILGGGAGLGGAQYVRSLVSVNPATFEVVGAGCPGSVGTPTLTSKPWEAAWTGDVTRIRLEGIPATTTNVIFAWGQSDTADAFGPLPRSLGGVGLPGCFQRTSLDILAAAPVIGGLAEATLTIPPSSSLAGFEFFAQALVPDPLANPYGGVLSDAARLVIGVR